MTRELLKSQEMENQKNERLNLLKRVRHRQTNKDYRKNSMVIKAKLL